MKEQNIRREIDPSIISVLANIKKNDYENHFVIKLHPW